MRSGNGSIDVVLADASTLTLDASASKWTGRAPSALAKRGDLVRVRRIETPVKKKAGRDGKGGDDAGDGGTAAEQPEVKVSLQFDKQPRAATTPLSPDPTTRELVAGTSG